MNSLIAASVLVCAGLVGADSSAEVQSIQKMLDAREQAWTERNIEALAADFSEDADTVSSSGTRTQGRSAIVEQYHKLLGSPKYAEAKFEQEITQIRILRPSLAVADGRWNVSGVKDDQGRVLPGRSGYSAVVLVHNGTKWEIVSLRSYAGSR